MASTAIDGSASLNVSPEFSRDDFVEMIMRDHGIAFRDAGDALTQVKPSADFLNITFLEFLFPLECSPPAFVVNIIPLCSQSQMRWINTGGIVTGMANNNMAGEFTMDVHHDGSVGVHNLALPGHPPVSSAVNVPSPFPALCFIFIFWGIVRQRFAKGGTVFSFGAYWPASGWVAILAVSFIVGSTKLSGEHYTSTIFYLTLTFYHTDTIDERRIA